MPEALEGRIEALVERAAETMESPEFAEASAWKAAAPGRAIAGCFPVYSPVEILHAAGMLPIGLVGGGNRLEITHADARFQSFVCSIVKSTLELGMTGVLDDVDALVFHNICDPARNLASVFARNFPGKRIEYVHFPQNLASPEAPAYLEAEYRRLLASMTELTGAAADDDALRASIALYDRIRRSVRRLYDLRREQPHLLATRELYPLVRLGHKVPPEAHAETLERALKLAQARRGKPRDRARVVVVASFCEQPPLDLIAAIEDSGCYVVDDDFLLGRRFFTGDVGAEAANPLRALAEAYIDRSVDASVKHDTRASRARNLVAKARACRADAVVVLTAKFCEPALFDYALYRAALHDAGIPHVFLEFEEKMWLFDRIRTEIETFVESLLFEFDEETTHA